MPSVSKKQQKFMGMVHAAQKGEKPASAKVEKVAKSMKKKDAKDFASTKHKGLPEKKTKEEEFSLDGDILTEGQKEELKKIIDVLVEERVQERIRQFSDKYTKFIVESATTKIINRVKGGLSDKINTDLKHFKEQTEKVCRSVVSEASGKIAKAKQSKKNLLEEFKRTAPNLIKKLAEEKANELSKEAKLIIEENQKLSKSLKRIMSGMKAAGYVINEDVEEAIGKERNEKLMLRTKLVEARRDLKLAQLTEGLLPNQKKQIIELLEDCTTEKMVEDRFLLAKAKIMDSNTHVDVEKIQKSETINELQEEESFDEFLKVIKNY